MGMVLTWAMLIHNLVYTKKQRQPLTVPSIYKCRGVPYGIFSPPLKLIITLGRYNDVLQLAQSLENSSQSYVEEAWYYRGLAYAAQGNTQQALNAIPRSATF